MKHATQPNKINVPLRFIPSLKIFYLFFLLTRGICLGRLAPGGLFQLSWRNIPTPGGMDRFTGTNKNAKQ
jgi:hypothetical protein